MEGNRTKIRLLILCALLFAMVFLIASRLYDIQVVNGSDYKSQSERKIVRSQTVPASRGAILDRYGRPLITNRLSYAISFDRDRISRDSAELNNIILDLIFYADQTGTPYAAGLPVSAPPFSYDNTASSVQQNRLKRFLKEKEWEGIGASDLMDRLRESYGLDESYSDYAAWQIARIRYELELRSLFNNITAYTFASDVDIELVSILRERGYPGIQVDSVTYRQYNTDFAAHILGRVGPIYEEEYPAYKELGYAMDETVGKDGAEKAFESWLRGISGVKTVETNAAGKVTGVLYSKEPQPGKNVMLTIDIRLQEAVERALEDNILKIRADGAKSANGDGADAQGGSAVVIDVKTGEVLALANYPTYSLKSFNADYAELVADPLKPMFNRALAGTYAPGSTFKMATAVAALESGTVTTRNAIYDHGIYEFYAPSYRPKCNIYPGSHGSVNVTNALKVSCNYYFYEVGRLTTIETMNLYAARLGFGRPTGIELEGEASGILAGRENSTANDRRWYDGMTLAAAIGQGDNAFTPIQLASYTATIANGGTRHDTHLLKAVKSYEYGETLFENTSSGESLGLDPDNIKAIQLGMRMVMQSGGTASSYFSGYPVATAGKTGSAQVTGVPANGVFVAYAPYDNPEIAVAVVVEKGAAGSKTAPIVRDIFDAYFGKDMQGLRGEGTLLK